MDSPRALTPTVRRITTVAATLVMLLAACGGSSGQDDASPSSSPVTANRVIAPDDYAAYLEQNPEVPLINVHVPYEGHIEGTDDFVPFDEIGDWEGLPDDKDAPIAIYCMSGNMSAIATKTLAAMGYRNITDLEGGMEAWSSAGYDLLQDEPTPG